jgi:DNA repair protein SbcC/Rad50
MLDDIVASANIHLSRLSRGRYTLVRTTEVSRGNGAKGLDLAVSDSWCGGERSVNTLSGGEMFLASLSLAFGLSDVVQSYAGGIRLDSLFIDEGFGSLDSETLDTAMNALESLRLSGRLIGVISHVGELSERIPAHIQVKRLADGSSGAAVETP